MEDKIYRITRVVGDTRLHTISLYEGTILRGYYSDLAKMPERDSISGQNIILTGLDERQFWFNAWSLTSMGGISYPVLSLVAQDASEQYQTRINDVYIDLCQLYHQCCCSDGSDAACDSEYLYIETDVSTSVGEGEFSFVDDISGGTIELSNISALDQDFTALFAALPNGTWLTFYDKSQRSLYFTVEISNYSTDVSSDTATWDAEVIDGDIPSDGITYCFSFDRTGGGSGGGVESVTGLDTDNTDPLNPIVQIAVDGITITGDGTPGDPLVAVTVETQGLQDVITEDNVLTLNNSILGSAKTLDWVNFQEFDIDITGVAGFFRALASDAGFFSRVYVDATTGAFDVSGSGTQSGKISVTNAGGAPIITLRTTDGAGQTCEIIIQEDKIFIQTPGVNLGTPKNGQPLLLMDETNGDSEFSGFVILAATATGTDTYAATIVPAPTAYITNGVYLITFTNGNTGASTLNLNTLGAKSLVKNTATALASGDIPAGKQLLCVYDGTNFQVIGIAGSGSLATPVSIANGGTNSGTALSNNRVMQSSAGAVVEAAAITAARALISDANGIPTHSATTSTELGYVSGVTSAIQTQLNAKDAESHHINLAAVTVNAGVTTYANTYAGAITFSATETARQCVGLRAGLARDYWVQLFTAQPGTGSFVWTLRKGTAGAAADTALTITIAAGSGAGNYSDIVNTVSCAAGDLFDHRAVNNAATASGGVLGVGFVIQ